MKAVCCWCGKGFFKHNGFYWCETDACREKQAEFSLGFGQADGSVIPFYVPLPKQIDFETMPVRYLLGGGAAGATKSHMARYGLYRRAWAVPNFEGLILRRTFPELEKHHLRLMERETRQLQQMGVKVRFVKGDREMIWPNGSIIEGGHMENEDDIEKYLSRERDAIVCDEGSTFPPKRMLELSTRARSSKPELAAFASDLWNMPLDDVIRTRAGGAVFWVLSNPGGQAALLLRDMFIDKMPDYEEFPQLRDLDSDGNQLYLADEWGFVKGDLEDNPYLPPDYERALAMNEPHRYKQLRYGNWDVLAGQFFVEFDSRVHVKDLGTPTGVRWFRSYDYGYVDYGCCHWWAILPDGRLYVRAELKHQYWDIERICKEICNVTSQLGIQRISYTVADKFSMGYRANDTTGQSRGRMFTSYGVPVVPTDHDREQGWTRVRELLRTRSDGLPWVVFHPSCRYLVRTMSAATSDRKNPEDIDFRDDHALDSFRLGAMSQNAPRESSGLVLPPNAIGHTLRQVQDGPDNLDPLAFR